MGVVVVGPEGSWCRRVLRSQAKAFSRRSLHFHDLVPEQRSESMRLFAELSGLRSVVFEHRREAGESVMDARAVVLRAVVDFLQDNEVSHLALDHFQGAEKIDGSTIRLARQRRDVTLKYSHVYYSDEPLLWIADGIAFNAGVKRPDEFPGWHEGTVEV